LAADQNWVVVKADQLASTRRAAAAAAAAAAANITYPASVTAQPPVINISSAAAAGVETASSLPLRLPL